MIKIVCVLAWLGLTPLYANTVTTPDLVLQRELYGRVEHALKKQDQVTYLKLLPQLESYPLYPYLCYEALKQKIQQSKPMTISLENIRDFEKKFPDFPFLNVLNNIWLAQVAKNKNWPLLIKGYRPSDNISLQCQYHFAKYQVTKDSAHLDAAKPIYLVGNTLPTECDALFEAWKKQGLLTPTIVWERTKLALTQKNTALATTLSKQLSLEKKNWVTQWQKAIKNPSLLLDKNTVAQFTLPASLKAEVFTQGLRDLVKKEPEKIKLWWENEHQTIAFSTIQSMFIRKEIGIYLAHQKNPAAQLWLANLPAQVLDPVSQEWRIRLALLHEDWPGVLHWIAQLPPELSAEKNWRYWQARALEKLGQPVAANSIYQELAPLRNYYGFLASLRLNLAPSMQDKEVTPSPEAKTYVANLPAMQRFEELLILNRMPLARVEWFRAINKMNSEQILAAAKLAQQKKMHDIAIFTIAKTDSLNDLPLRFPLAYQQSVVKNANLHNLDPAWVYAVARQESAFYTDAVSSAGAKGLMQLMPATAHIIAKQSNIWFPSVELLHDPYMNIQLGTVYLKNLKKSSNDHIIIATASYNAGPTRARKWLPTKTVEADIWIENIPYRETREYVKNVLTFTTIYRLRMGHPTALALLMKPIPGLNSEK